MLALPVLLALGVASPPVRPSRAPQTSRVVRGRPVPLAPQPAEGHAPPARVPSSLSGSDIVQNPNVFRGVSSTGEMQHPPLPLGREEEVEVRARAAAVRPARACPPGGAGPPN